MDAKSLASHAAASLSSRGANWMAIAGVLGGLLFFCGDMLFYGHWGAGDRFKEGMTETVRHGSLARLFLGGLVGPVAACLCLIGFWRVRANVIVRHPRLGQIAFLACAAMMVAGGALHTLWVTRGLAMRYADELRSTGESCHRH